MILDSQKHVHQIDKSGMLDILDTFPHQMEEGVRIGNDIPAFSGDINKVIIVGVGGSAFTGDVIRAYGKKKLVVPIFVNKDYSLPGYIDSKTLIMVLSYSGDSEETISAFKEASGLTSKIFTISSGGRLETLSKKKYCYVKVPKGFQPRAAVAFLLIPSLVFLHKSGLIQSDDNFLTEALHWVSLLNEKINQDVPSGRNMAKQIAGKLEEVTPKIYGYGMLAPIARRWRTQFNENSKIFAFNDEVPECNHNEIESWGQKNSFHYLFLRSPDELPSIRSRYDVMKEGLDNYTEVWAEGHGIFSQMMYLMHLGDYISVYHAVLRGIDPSPVSRIEAVKKRVGSLGSS